jgi:hypothetical protein
MSRIPPKMKQRAAGKAGVYHVLPVTAGQTRFSVDVSFSEKPRTSEHYLTAAGADGKVLWRSLVFRYVYNEQLEGDVQDVFPIDLFVEEDNVVVELEHRGLFKFNRLTGERIVV